MAENRRSLRNYLVDPNFQLKYGLYFAAAGVIAIGAQYFIVLRSLNTILEQVTMMPSINPEAAQSLASEVYGITLQTLMVFVLTAFFSFLFAIYMTHRIAGPARNIENYIREMISGKYSTGRKLRNQDDLQAVMAALNDLASHLEKTNRP